MSEVKQNEKNKRPGSLVRNERMKIVAGMGTLDDYKAFVEAGADELFAGVIPGSFLERYGRYVPLNRREVQYTNVQLGTESELMILQGMVQKAGVPVSITLNSLNYIDEAFEDILEVVDTCVACGFTDFTVADLRLIGELGQRTDITLRISGELGELNSGVIAAVREMAPNARRFIYPRQTAIEEMAELSRRAGEAGGPELQFEAFALNEKCHYTGAYCNCLHCDELQGLCRVPYKVATGDGSNIVYQGGGRVDQSILGVSGCGICSLWKLARAGVTHLKLVGRGNYTKVTERDIKALRRALDILEGAKSEEEYISEVKKELFPNGCGGNCYYY